jgi:hypothetical protein
VVRVGAKYFGESSGNPGECGYSHDIPQKQYDCLKL